MSPYESPRRWGRRALHIVSFALGMLVLCAFILSFASHDTLQDLLDGSALRAPGSSSVTSKPPSSLPDPTTSSPTEAPSGQSHSACHPHGTAPIIVWLKNGPPKGNDPFQELVDHAADVCSASPFWYGPVAGGKLKTTLEPGQIKQVRQAQAAGVELWPTIRDSGDTTVMRGILAHPETFIQTVTDTTVREHFQGIDLDFEGIAFGTSDGLSAAQIEALSPKFTAMVHQLATSLHQHHVKLAVTIVPSTGTGDTTASRFFDYHGLAAADQVRLMDYDEHWETGPAGPVASAAWVRKRLQYALSQLPASKIVHGIPTYGDDFAQNSSIEYTDAKALLGQGNPSRDPASGELKLTSGGQSAWYSDACTTAFRLHDLDAYLSGRHLKAAKLGGIGVFRLGDEPPGQWTALTGGQPAKSNCLAP